jgi:TatD family-associated radical SAM protein
LILSYEIGDSLYLNITNRCNCACVFCVRQGRDEIEGSGSLWLEREPTAAEIIADLETRELKKYRELVYCGYGEPTESLDVLIETAKWLKKTAPGIPLRLNTNGLGEISHGKAVAPLLRGLIDSVSISLNAPDAARYAEVTRPCGRVDGAYAAMLAFAEGCKANIPIVQFTVVDILNQEDIERCKALADEMGSPLRVRTMIEE